MSTETDTWALISLMKIILNLPLMDLAIKKEVLGVVIISVYRVDISNNWNPLGDINFTRILEVNKP